MLVRVTGGTSRSDQYSPAVDKRTPSVVLVFNRYRSIPFLRCRSSRVEKVFFILRVGLLVVGVMVS